MTFGLDHLGGARYADLAAREHPAGFAFGIFWSVDGFGSSEELIKRVAKEGRAPIIRVHGIWKDAHNFSRNDFKEAVTRAKKLDAIAKLNGNVEFRYSPFCEHNLNAKDMREAFSLIRSAAPRLTLVNAPNGTNNTIIDEVVNEFHGGKKNTPKCSKLQFSFDGASAEDSDIESYKEAYKKSEIFFLWSPRFNGRWEDNDKTPRPLRKGWPDSNFIDSIIYLARDRGECKLQKDHLYKSHSENKGKGDPRAEKPVYLCPIKARSVELVARNGQVVSALRYYGTFENNKYRYYATEWGYQIAEKAKRIQGDPMCLVRIEGKFCGIINPGFRFGNFR